MIPEQNKIDIFNSGQVSLKGKNLRIIHFNDVYNIEESEKEPVGGAARFSTAVHQIQKTAPSLTVFSGDAFSPSKLSLYAKGQQMIDVLNKLNIDAACIGNHEFDMGLDNLEKLLDESNFPWLLSNVYDSQTESTLLKLDTQVVFNIDNVKVGLFGLAEKDWVRSLACVNYDDLIFEPYVECSRRITNYFRHKHHVDIVIALTHMRWKNDERLLEKVPGIDLVLGGHDHEYLTKQVKDRWIIKSGTDFKELSVIDVNIAETITVEKIEKIIIDSNIPKDRHIQSIADHYLENISGQLERVLGYVNCDLDGRHEIIRSQETNLGNLFCDIMMSGTNADCALLNSGAFRSNRIHDAGTFKLRDLHDILSFDSQLFVVQTTGRQLHRVLENGVAKYGEGGGRFPQVSGIQFEFDPLKTPGKRIEPRSIRIQNRQIEFNTCYRLVTNGFMRNVDDVLVKCPELVSDDNTPILHSLVENYLSAVENINNNIDIYKNASSIIPDPVSSIIYNKVNEDMYLLQKVSLFFKKMNNEKHTFKKVALIVIKYIKLKKLKIIPIAQKMLIRTSRLYKQKLMQYLEKPLKMAPEIESRSVLINNRRRSLKSASQLASRHHYFS